MKNRGKTIDEDQTSTRYTPSKSGKKCNPAESLRNHNCAQVKQDQVTTDHPIPSSQFLESSDWNRYLLPRTESQWQFGAWDKIAELSLDGLSHHPERARLAVLAGSAQLQLGNYSDGKQFLKSAVEWGCGYEDLLRILVSGVHNSLGKAVVASNSHEAAHPYFERAIRIGAPSVDYQLVTGSRHQHQADHLRKALGAPYTRNNRFPESGSLPEESGAQAGWTYSAGMQPQYSNDKIKVFGPPRSGTNFLRALLEWNAECTVVYSQVGGWKHQPVSDEIGKVLERNGLYSVHLVKNPLAQILSLYRYNKTVGRNIRASRDWYTFLRSPLILTNDDHDPRNVEHRFRNPADYWNSATWAAVSYVQKNSATNLMVRYEDLLDSPSDVISQVASLAGLRFRRGMMGFEIPSNTLRRMGDESRNKNSDYVTGQEFDASYYSEESYRSEFSVDDIEFLESELDSDLLARLGYAPS